MHSPALAIGWELWARNRWGLSAILAGFTIVALLSHALPKEIIAEPVGNVCVLLVFFVFLYLLSIFVLSDTDRDLSQSGFPSRMFTMPVPTRWLVGWPMLYGMLTVASLWIGVAGLILVPSGLMPRMVWWPAFLFAAGLAWFPARG